MAKRWNEKRWGILPAYVFCGLILGMADGELGRLVQQLGVRPGLATALSVNILLPLAAVALGVVVPLLRTVWVGAVAMSIAYGVGLAISHPPAVPMNPAALPALVHPILAVACAGYGVVGTCAVLATRALSMSEKGESNK
jgi:hypothetical protein